MKTAIALLLGSLISTSAYAYVPKHVVFRGNFQTINFSSPECESLITKEEFRLTHTLTGASGRTSVLNFKGRSASFLHNQTLVGLFGYNNDFLDEKNFKLGALTYRIVAKGLVDHRFIVAQVKVTVIDPALAKVVCTADAEIYGN